MTDTVKGRVQAISPKPQKDYMGVNISVDGDEDWFNGSDEDVPSMSKGDLIKVEHDDGWIQEITILEEDSEGAESAGSDAGNGGEGSNSSKKPSSTTDPKRANIQATAATKKAADIVAEHRTVEEGEFEQQVSVVASGLNRIMNKLYEENMQND